jgi:hypothetical protein
MDRKSAFVSLIGCMLLAACQKQPATQLSEVRPPMPTPAQSIPVTPFGANTRSPGITSSGAAGDAAYDKVASKLDPGGVGYLYWNTEKILGELSEKFGLVADGAISDPGLTPSERERIRKCFELASRLTAGSGLQNVKAFGFSSKEAEPGLFLSKSYFYVPDRSGFLWGAFAKPPHDFAELEMIPAKAEAFAFYDFDLPLFWKAISKEIESSKIPEVTRWEEQIARQAQLFGGSTLDDLLDSLDDRIGVIVTLDTRVTVDIPLGNKPYKMPAPAAALLWKVRNDRVFDRVDALAKRNPKVESADEADLRLRLLKGLTELPYLSPTLARTGNYIIFSTSEELVRAITDAKSGKAPGIKSSSDFARLAAGMPEKGNCVTYVSKTFQKVLADLQVGLNEVRWSQDPLLEAITTRFARLSADISSYGVGSVVADGWLSYGKATKDMNELLGEFASLPAYCVAVAAVEYAKEARQSSRLNKIKENLANLQAAKDEAIAEKNLENGQALARQDVEDYLAAWPDSVVGETYEVGPVGQPPYAIAPIDLGNYPAGTKIEP